MMQLRGYLGVLALVLSPSPAVRTAAADGVQMAAVMKPREVVIDGSMGTVPVTLHSAVATYVEFPCTIRSTHLPHAQPKVRVEHQDRKVRITVHPRAVHLAVDVQVDCAIAQVNLRLRVGESRQEADPQVRIVTRSEAEARAQEIAAAVAKANAANQAMLEKLRAQVREAKRELKRQSARLFLGPIIEYRPVGGKSVVQASGLIAKVGHARPRGDDLEVRFELKNSTGKPFALQEVRRVNKAGQNERIDIVETDRPAGEGGVVATLAPGQTLAAVAVVPKAADPLEGLELALLGPGNKLLAVVSSDHWEPIPDEWKEELELARHERERAQRQVKAEGLITVHGQGALGIIVLGNPLDETQTAAALLTAVGFRVTYGLSPLFSVQADVVGAWSGKAEFEDAMQGKLTRKAKLGRVQAGFVMQFGEKIRPNLRAGAGLQGVLHNAEFVATPGQGPDTDFEFEPVWFFGGGVNWQLTESFALGVDVTSIGEAMEVVGDGTSAVVQFGAHAAWSWKSKP